MDAHRKETEDAYKEQQRRLGFRRWQRIQVAGECACRVKIVAQRAVVQKELTVRELERGWHECWDVFGFRIER
jgi:hypothetical protein